jgi:hypothetical protein
MKCWACKHDLTSPSGTASIKDGFTQCECPVPKRKISLDQFFKKYKSKISNLLAKPNDQLKLELTDQE